MRSEPFKPADPQRRVDRRMAEAVARLEAGVDALGQAQHRIYQDQITFMERMEVIFEEASKARKQVPDA